MDAHATHVTNAPTVANKPMGLGMKVMVAMMTLCVGGTTLAAGAPLLGLPLGAVLAVLVGAGFGWASWTYHRAMGLLMGLCCGVGATVIWIGTTPWWEATLIGLGVGLVVGIASHYAMRRLH